MTIRRGLLAGVLLLLVSAAISANSPDLALVAVDHPGPTTVATLLDADVMVVRDMQRYLLLAATPADLTRLDQLDLRWEMLDPSIAGKTYYTVGVGSADNLFRGQR